MFGSRVIQLASMGWSLSVVALVLKSGLLVALVAPPDGKQDPLSVSIPVLKQSEVFKAAAVGEAGITPNEVLAWRVIFNSPDRYSVFRDLLATGSTSGRLYALARLWFGNADEFVAGAKKLRTEGGMITTVRGCIVSSESLGGLIDEIAAGDWSREFLAAGRVIMVR